MISLTFLFQIAFMALFLNKDIRREVLYDLPKSWTIKSLYQLFWLPECGLRFIYTGINAPDLSSKDQADNIHNKEITLTVYGYIKVGIVLLTVNFPLFIKNERVDFPQGSPTTLFNLDQVLRIKNAFKIIAWRTDLLLFSQLAENNLRALHSWSVLCCSYGSQNITNYSVLLPLLYFSVIHSWPYKETFAHELQKLRNNTFVFAFFVILALFISI